MIYVAMIDTPSVKECITVSGFVSLDSFLCQLLFLSVFGKQESAFLAVEHDVLRLSHSNVLPKVCWTDYRETTLIFYSNSRPKTVFFAFPGQAVFQKIL